MEMKCWPIQDQLYRISVVYSLSTISSCLLSRLIRLLRNSQIEKRNLTEAIWKEEKKVDGPVKTFTPTGTVITFLLYDRPSISNTSSCLPSSFVQHYDVCSVLYIAFIPFISTSTLAQGNLVRMKGGNKRSSFFSRLPICNVLYKSSFSLDRPNAACWPKKGREKNLVLVRLRRKRPFIFPSIRDRPCVCVCVRIIALGRMRCMYERRNLLLYFLRQ